METQNVWLYRGKIYENKKAMQHYLGWSSRTWRERRERGEFELITIDKGHCHEEICKATDRHKQEA